MKLHLYVLAAVTALALSACSGNGYNAGRAEALCEKVMNGDELSQADYSDMITQCEGAASVIGEQFDEVLRYKREGNAAKMAEAFEKCTDSKIMNAASTFQTLGTALQTAPLDERNAARWHEFQPKAVELVSKMFTVFQ